MAGLPGLINTFSRAGRSGGMRGDLTSIIHLTHNRAPPVEPRIASLRAAGLSAREVSAEGRNFVALLELARKERADLVTLGATGLSLGDLVVEADSLLLLQAPSVV